MGMEKASIVHIDENTGTIILPIQFRNKLRFSKVNFISLYNKIYNDYSDDNLQLNINYFSINHNIKNKNNIREESTNRIKEFNFDLDKISVMEFTKVFIKTDLIEKNIIFHYISIWFDENKKELVFLPII